MKSLMYIQLGESLLSCPRGDRGQRVARKLPTSHRGLRLCLKPRQAGTADPCILEPLDGR